jgi:hypothetical protein
MFTIASHDQIMDYLGLIDLSLVLVFICIIGFVIRLYLILLIDIKHSMWWD